MPDISCEGKIEARSLFVDGSEIFPAGIVLAFGGTSIPAGYLLCDGRAVSRTQYARLFNAIGTSYGEGDGLTSFNLPNLMDRFIQGKNEIVKDIEAKLPNIKGGKKSGSILYGANTEMQGAFQGKSNTTVYSSVGSGSGKIYYSPLDFDASKSNPIYSDNCNTVQPPAVGMKYIIKY